MAGPAPSHEGEAAASETADSSQRSTASKRRRTGGPSSRGVANLTPEQLSRKRANDREAQRAIRERTKKEIDRLNQRIRELESQQPYQHLQLVVREKDAIRAENAEIRQLLESVVSMIQPVLRPGGLTELAAAAARSPLPTALPTREPPPHTQAPPDVASPPNGVHSPAGPEPSRPWMFPANASTSHVRRWLGESNQFEQGRPPPQPQAEMPFDERLGVDFLLDSGQRRVDPNLPPPHQPAASRPSVGQQAPSLVPHLTFPRTIPATCPLDALMLDFLSDQHARAAEGEPLHLLAGPPYPNFAALVSPERGSDTHELRNLFTNVIRTFPDISGLPEQVAVVFIMFLVMRWQIEPTQENYDRLPEWVTPRASQLFVSHPYWFNMVPWPRLRDKLISTQPFTSFDSFFIPYTTTISLNWPYEPRDCLLRRPKPNRQSSTPSAAVLSPYSATAHASPVARQTPQSVAGTPGTASCSVKDDDEWVINPAFESHLRDLKNWSLGPSFRRTFPHFADTVRIKEFQ